MSASNPSQNDEILRKAQQALDLAKELTARCEYTKAEAIYPELIKLFPTELGLQQSLALLYLKTFRVSEAVSILQRCVSQQPDNVIFLFNLSLAYRAQGHQKQAAELLEKIAELDSGFTRALRELSLCQRYQDEHHNHRSLFERALQNVEPESEAAMHVYYALGKFFDDCGQFQQAFESFQKANEIRSRLRPFDQRGYQTLINQIKTVFDQSYFKSLERRSSSQKQLVFIVGMPRSGTSLLEQILSSHSQVFCIGESPLLPAAVDACGEGVSWMQKVRELSSEERQVLRERYLGQIEPHCPAGAQVIVDKNPFNFHYVGFIASLFPEARFIHCQRDELDVRLSCYFQHFEEQPSVFDNWEQLKEYHDSCFDLMTHWKTVSGLPILDWVYEELISDQKTQIPRLIEFLELPWEESCLSFEKSKNPVFTASAAQVRKPLYQSSVKRFEKYQRYFESSFKEARA